MAGWFPGYQTPRRPRPVAMPEARSVAVRVWPKRKVIVSLAFVDVRRTSDGRHV
jgi:hypothetical protein